MSGEFEIIECEEPSCPIRTRGVCLDGFADLRLCPHVTKGSLALDLHEKDLPLSADVEFPSADEHVLVSPRKLVSFYGGGSLSPAEVEAISSQERVHRVVLVGRVKSGKTTLLAELINGFNVPESFHNVAFAGPHSLLAFDERSFDSRPESGRDTAETPRNPHSLEAPYIDLSMVAPQGRRRFLIADLTGEHYEYATDTTPDLLRLGFLSGSEHFAFLFDGAKLADKFAWQQEIAFQTLLLRRMAEHGFFTKAVTL